MRIKQIILALVLLLCNGSAWAQTGSVLTQTQLNTFIGATYPDQTVGQITPYGLRQGLLNLTATMFAGGGTAPVSGPSVSTVGCAAPWANTTGTLLANNCALSISGNVVKSATSLVTPTTDGQSFLVQNGSKTAIQIYGPSAPANEYDWGNFRSVIDIEPGTTVQNYNAFDGWIWNNVAAGGYGQAGIGAELYCANVVANASCFGINPALTDSYDGTAGHSVASAITGGEVDLSVYNSGTTATGMSFVIQGSVTSAGDVIQALYNASATTKWGNGFVINDGALVSSGAGLLLGATAASGSSLSSDPVVFNIFDTSSAEHHIYLSGIPSSTNSGVKFVDGSLNTLEFLFAASGSAPSINAIGGDTNINVNLTPKGSGGVIDSGPLTIASTLYGGTAAGAGLVLTSTSNGTPSADYVELNVGGADAFDCGLSSSGYCTVKATNGLALNNLPIVQGNNIASNNAAGYELNSGAASATAPTFSPNFADKKAGIGAAASGDVSVIADVSGTATEIARFDTSGLITLPLVTTGTPATYACFDSSNHLIKSSTAC